MEVYGIVKHVELAKKENWKHSLLLLTLDVNGIEFIFPVEKGVIEELSIGSTIGLDIEAYPLNWQKNKDRYVDNEPEEAKATTETIEQVSSQTIQVSTPKPQPPMKLTDEELKDLYGVDDNVIPISKDIRVDSNLEDVSESEFTQFDQPTVETATGESKLSAKEDKNDTNKNEKNKAMIKLPELSKKNKSKALNPANKAMLGSLAGSLGSGIEESPED